LVQKSSLSGKMVISRGNGAAFCAPATQSISYVRRAQLRCEFKSRHETALNISDSLTKRGNSGAITWIYSPYRLPLIFDFDLLKRPSIVPRPGMAGGNNEPAAR
jgi:hypothetical protein